VANRRALETLILSGAFDSTELNRNQLIHDLDLVITWCQKRAKEKETGQTNLFDLVGGSSSASSTATES
jgi:DNA polymerase-3 subunit alpha